MYLCPKNKKHYTHMLPYHELGKTGMKISALSFGASSLGGVFHDLKEKEGIEAVFTAIEAGMNFIDVTAVVVLCVIVKSPNKKRPFPSRVKP